MEKGFEIRQLGRSTWLLLSCSVLALSLVGCGQDGGTDDSATPTEAPPSVVDKVVEPAGPAPMARAMLKPAATNEGLGGTIHFSEAEGAVSLVVKLEGAPAGTHGLFIHDVGDCSASDFSSAGGRSQLGGDLAKIEVGANGMADLKTSSSQITLGEGDRSIMGRAVVVHKNADEQATEARIACGVIEAVSADAEEASADDAGADDQQAAH